jgi:hypothetical protein
MRSVFLFHILNDRIQRCGIFSKIGFAVKITDVNSDVCKIHSDFRLEWSLWEFLWESALISWKKENKTKYRAKIDIFLIDSEQIKYVEHFKIKIIPVKITDVNSDVCKIHSDFRSGIICFTGDYLNLEMFNIFYLLGVY